jgi:hypothetical protein
LAMALFWASWVLYCQITGVDVYSWWNFTVKGKMATGQLVIHHFIAARGWEAAIQRIWASIRVSISWISLPYVILFFIAAVVRIKDIISGKKQIGFIELCLLYALVLFAITKIVRPTNFIKYENPAYLLVAIFISDVFFANFRKHLSAFLAVAMVGIVVGIGLYSVIPDRILSLRSYFPTHVLQGIGITVAVAALFYIRKTALMTSAVAGLVAGIIVLNMNLYVHQSLNDYTTGQSWGNYGEDLVAPTKWLKKHLKNGEGFAAFKDLQFNMRFMEGKTKSPTWEARLFTKDNAKKQQKRRLLNSGRIQYIDLNRYSNDRRGRAFLETNNYRKVKKIGDHIIYERVDCPYCEKRQVNKKESVRSAKRRRPENQRDDISGKSGFSYIFPQVGPAAERNSA